jgi:hypothetical protein
VQPSTFNEPNNVSVTALSQQSPFRLIEPRMPKAESCFWKSPLAYWLPRRFSGTVSRKTTISFAMMMSLPKRKQEALVDQLTWHANRHLFGTQDGRRHERIVPLIRRSLLRDFDSSDHLVKIRDLSTSGVSIETKLRPDLGTLMLIGNTPVIIVRHFDDGIAAKFVKSFVEGEIDESTRL